VTDRRAARAALPVSLSAEWEALTSELVSLVGVTGWGYQLGAPHAEASYARMVELAEMLGCPPPPPIEDLGQSGAWTPADQWLTECGLG
jgi:hypothetical protein